MYRSCTHPLAVCTSITSHSFITFGPRKSWQARDNAWFQWSTHTAVVSRCTSHWWRCSCICKPFEGTSASLCYWGHNNKHWDTWRVAGNWKNSYFEAQDCCSLAIAIPVMCALRLWRNSNVVCAMRTPSDVECHLPIVQFFFVWFLIMFSLLFVRSIWWHVVLFICKNVLNFGHLFAGMLLWHYSSCGSTPCVD